MEWPSVDSCADHEVYIDISCKSGDSGAVLTANEMVVLQNTLEEMGWKQQPSPIQCDNSTTLGYTNQTSVSRKLTSWDLRFKWLRCRAAQDQFRIYWGSSKKNMDITTQIITRPATINPRGTWVLQDCVGVGLYFWNNWSVTKTFQQGCVGPLILESYQDP